MFKMVESVDKLLEIQETSVKRQERDIIAGLIVAVNLIAICIYPIYRIFAVVSGFKGGALLSQLYFSLRDRLTESHGNVKFQGKSKNLLKEARRLGCPPEPISHSNHGGAPVPRPALLEPVYISTREMMSAAGFPSESLSAAATTGAKYSGLAPTPPIRHSKISTQMVYKISREESFIV